MHPSKLFKAGMSKETGRFSIAKNLESFPKIK
jgi:hypothetical protein